MKKILLLFISAIMLGSIAGCSAQNSRNKDDLYGTEARATTTQETVMEQQQNRNDNLMINGYGFHIRYEDNATVAALQELLPSSFAMQELHGNEKYVYLDGSLPSTPETIGSIHAGDVMLFGNNCLVIFYDSFETEYTYTRIGRIEDVSDLKTALGNGDITADFR